MNYSLRFDLSEVDKYAGLYLEGNSSAQAREDNIENNIGPVTKQQGHYTRSDFLDVCFWKTPRSQHLCEQNEDAFVEEATAIALNAKHERLRIEALRSLDGVDWPIASVLLHFGHKDRYPILDFRALWSIGWEQPNIYTFSFWLSYVYACRELADRADVSMRMLDRALWKYSFDNQKD